MQQNCSAVTNYKGSLYRNQLKHPCQETNRHDVMEIFVTGLAASLKYCLRITFGRVLYMLIYCLSPGDI